MSTLIFIEALVILSILLTGFARRQLELERQPRVTFLVSVDPAGSHAVYVMNNDGARLYYAPSARIEVSK